MTTRFNLERYVLRILLDEGMPMKSRLKIADQTIHQARKSLIESPPSCTPDHEQAQQETRTECVGRNP